MIHFYAMHINNSLNTYTVFNLDIHEFVSTFFLLKVFFRMSLKYTLIKINQTNNYNQIKLDQKKS